MSSSRRSGYSKHASLRAREARERGDLDTLLELLSSSDRLERIYAVANLGDADDPRVRAALVRCLQSSDDQLRIGALKAFANLGAQDAVEDVFDLAVGDTSAEVRVTAIQTLVTLRDRRATEPILTMLRRDDLPWPRWYGKWASKALVELDAVDAIPALEAMRVTGLVTRLRLRRTIRLLKRPDR